MTTRSALPVDIYIRVSRRGKREHLISPADQEAQARTFAASKGLPTGIVITDIDESGGTLDRPGLSEALSRIEAGVSGGIVAAYLSRASRDTAQGLLLLDRITAAGGSVWAPNLPENYRTADGRMTATIQLAIDTGQRERKAEEFDRAKGGAVASGRPVHPRLAPGLRPILNETGRRVGVEHDPEVVPAIREMFDARLSGAGPKALGELLQARGVRTSMGAETWSRAAIYGLLSNRAYIGELRNGDHVNPKAWLPIVDPAVWHAVQSPTDVPKPSRTRVREPGLAVGLVRCWSCRYSLQYTPHGRGYAVYRCSGRHAGGICTARAAMRADVFEPLLLAAFWSLAESGEGRQVDDGAGAAVDALQSAYDRAVAARDAYRDDDALDETIEAMGGRDVWLAGMKRHTKRVEDAAAELGRATSAAARPERPAVADLRRDWPTMTNADRRERIAEVIDTVAIKPASGGRTPAERVVVFAAGHAPLDLPRRGYKSRPGLRSFDDPPPAVGSA